MSGFDGFDRFDRFDRLDKLDSNEINLYDILEINSDSTDKEIKSAWKKLILKYHPDKNNNISSDKFIKIKYAYDILSNKDLKKQYDNELKFRTNSNYVFNIFNLNLNLNLKNNIINFMSVDETEKIIQLMLKKKGNYKWDI